jgi:hypothetical protein
MGGSFPYHPGEAFGDGVSCLGHPDEDNEVEGSFQHHLGDGNEGPTPSLFGTLDGELLAGKATWDLLEADHIVGVTAHELPSALSTSRVHQLEVSGGRGVGSPVYRPCNNPDLRAPIGGCIGGSFPYHPGEIFARGVSCQYHIETYHEIGGCFPYHPGEIFARGVSCPYNPDLKVGCPTLYHLDKDHEIGGPFPYHSDEVFARGVSCQYHPDTDHEIGGCFLYHPGEIFARGCPVSTT